MRDDDERVHEDGATRERGFATAQVHAGQERPDPASGARAVPIHATTSYVFDGADHAEAVFAGTEPGDRYARMDNPTVAAFEARLAALEGAGAGSTVAFASGQAATTTAMLALAAPGRTWVVSEQLFGGTASVVREVLEPWGVEVRWVAPEPDAVAAALDERVVGVWAETIANPSGHVPDLPALADVAHAAGAPLVVDNTWGAGGYLCRPLAWGADVVVHSATKWIGGHGVAMGGALVDGGRFAWGADPDRFPALHRPDARGRSPLASAPAAPVAAAARRLGLGTMGMTLSPYAAFSLLQGLETLDLRVGRASASALALARAWRALDGVEAVVYPGLEDHPSHAVARRVLRGGFGTVLTVRFASEALARATLDRVRLMSHLANVGDAKTVVIHPWTTTHAGLTPAARRAAGVTPADLRISVGIEALEDVEADLGAALAGARRAVGA